MNKEKRNFYHLINNLERVSSENSIFNKRSGQKAFLSLEKGNIGGWLETFLPNTRLILEPQIIGSKIAIQYINGTLNKVINRFSHDITKEVISQTNIPKSLPIKKKIEIQGILYNSHNKHTIKTDCWERNQHHNQLKVLNFCAFQIFHCNINQFQTLQELKKLNFNIPQNHFTNYISDVDIYYQCWKEGKLFQNYPTSGIVLKINSRKLQKYLGENNLSLHWAYAIN